MLRHGLGKASAEKAPGYSLETIVGFDSQTRSFDELYVWVEHTFEPLLDAAYEAYIS
jgi:hypothetical protein